MYKTILLWTGLANCFWPKERKLSLLLRFHLVLLVLRSEFWIRFFRETDVNSLGTLSVWEQDYATVQRKIGDCIQLHDRYIENYQRESNRFEEQVRLGRLDPSKLCGFNLYWKLLVAFFGSGVSLIISSFYRALWKHSVSIQCI